MKKAITSLFLLAFIGFANCQTPSKDKAKTTTPAIQKDSVKKDKPLAIQPEIIFNDSVIMVTGKFRPYKSGVHASYYADKFNGKRTSSGRKFSNKKYTAAHRKFPFGTILRVTNEANGQCVLVEVTDRGPFTRGREIDLTRRAFMEIAHNKSSGGIKVTIEVANQQPGATNP